MDLHLWLYHFTPHIDRNMSEGKKSENGSVEQDEDLQNSPTKKVNSAFTLFQWHSNSFSRVYYSLIGDKLYLTVCASDLPICTLFQVWVLIKEWYVKHFALKMKNFKILVIL